MANNPASQQPAAQAAPQSDWQRALRFLSFFKKGWAVAILAALMVLWIISNLMSWSQSSPSASSSSGNEWKVVALVTDCQPVWNEKQGWCDMGNFPKGRYRVVPMFETWQMKLMPSNPPRPEDLAFLPIPPQGIDVYTYAAGNKEFISNFLRASPAQSRDYGALVVKIDGGQVIQAARSDSTRLPREFDVSKDDSRFSLGVNLPPLPGNYNGNQGPLTVEVQRRD